MDIAEHIAALQREGERLGTAAARCALETPIPTCPGWCLRDLLRHIGVIHRWATAHVSGTRSGAFDPFKEMTPADWPADATLLDWFRAGHAELVRALQAAPPTLACFTFLPAPSPLAFWARRQAHETTIHRADAEAASGSITPCAPALARDGIDELLFGFAARPGSRLTADPPRTLHVHALDTPGEWLVAIGPQGPTISAEHAAADCTLSGSASDLYLLLWNRRPPDGLSVQGDADLLDRWRTAVRIRWA